MKKPTDIRAVQIGDVLILHFDDHHMELAVTGTIRGGLKTAAYPEALSRALDRAEADAVNVLYAAIHEEPVLVKSFRTAVRSTGETPPPADEQTPAKGFRRG
jgi:hypothetical protein